jgi:glycosyltransferase involved in cell wall biosynthesis
MIKVLHIIDSGGLYGAEVMLLNLVAEQTLQGLEPVIASIGEKNITEKPLETEAIRCGFKIKKIRMIPGPNIAGVLEILKFAKRNNFSLLHLHGYKGNILFGFIPKKFRKIPVITTLHGYTSTIKFNKMKVYEWLDQKSLSFLDAVVFVSNAMKIHPKLKNLNNKNIYVIPNGIPMSDNKVTKVNDIKNQTSDKKIKGFCSQGFTIGSIGRLSTEKGYQYLIKAVSLLEKRGINTRLILVGEGHEREFLEKLTVQSGLEGKILFTGYMDDAKNYIPFFNIYIIASLTEGLPITLLEAMQAKIPIIATKVGGIPEVLSNGQAGILIDSCSPDAIVQAVIKLYNDKELSKQLTNKAHRRVNEDFSSKRMAAKYLDVYENL